MHHAETDELRVFETWNQRQDPGLFAPLQLRLESDQAEVIARQIILPQLHHGVRRPACTWIDKAHRLHGSEPQRLAPSMRHHLDRQTPFKERGRVEVVHGGGFRTGQRVVEAPVLIGRHWAVQVVTLPVIDAAGRACRVRCRWCRRVRASQTPAPPRCPEHLRHVERLGQDDRADRVIEGQMLVADECGYLSRQGIRRQRSRRHDQRKHRRVGRHARHLLPHNRDQWMGLDGVGDGL